MIKTFTWTLRPYMLSEICDLGRLEHDFNSELVNRLWISPFYINATFYRWIDRRTRALFVDFVFFNGYTNLFTIVKFAFEVPSCGELIQFHDMDSIRLYTYVGEAGLVLLIMQLLWLMIFVVSTVREFRVLFKNRKTYFSSGWNCLKMSNVAVVCATIVAFTLKSIYIQLTREEVKNNIGKENYVESDPVASFLMNTITICCIY